MNRRDTVLVLVALGAAPLAAVAQEQGKVWRVGFLSPTSRPASIDANFLGAFPRGMRDLGYVEGRNLAIDWRFADNQRDRLAPLAAELVQLKVDVIVTLASPATLVAQKATTTIPIVFVILGNPINIGLVKSFARPEGNTTGLASVATNLVPKRLEMLLSIASTPARKVTRVAYLLNPQTRANLAGFEELLELRERFGVGLQRVDASTVQEIETAFDSIMRNKAGALIVATDAFFEQQKNQIGQLSVKHRLPSVAGDRMYAEAGCLMSYGTSLVDLFRQSATYVNKIFRGAKPADMPVEQPTKLELVINRKTANALGLTIPPSLLTLADRVIE